MLSDWDPPFAEINSLCEYYQPSFEEYGKCPPDYIESSTDDLCYRWFEAESWEDRCLHTGASSLSFFDLTASAQYNFLNDLSKSNPLQASLYLIGMPAKNTYPSKRITRETDYNIEDVELQWLLPGRFGSIKTFSNNSAAVICGSYRDLCVDMCLSVNGSDSSVESPFMPRVVACSSINSILCVARKNSMLRRCSKQGYHRVAYATGDSRCYYIKMMASPRRVRDGSDQIVQDECKENGIFHINSIESHIIFNQLANLSKLKMSDRCLFGVGSLTGVLTSNYWASNLNYDEVSFTNWDMTRDFEVGHDNFLTVNPNGKWSWEQSASCIVCAMEDPPSSVELLLQFNTNISILTLHVVGQEYLWKDNRSQTGFLCFALVDEIYKSDLLVSYKRALGFYSVENVGTGHYWCSGHVVRSFDFIKTKEVYAFGMVFVVLVDRHCNENCVEPLDHAEEFKEFLEENIDEELMKIEDVYYIENDMDHTDAHMKLVLHMTIAIKEALLQDNEHNEIGLSADQLHSYYVSRKLQELAMENRSSEFYIFSVTSMEFCLPDSIKSLGIMNWKAAAVGETIELKERCLKLTRTCSRSGSGGAAWDDHFTIKFTCSEQCESKVTKILLDLHNYFRSPQQTTDVISNLSVSLQNVTLIAGDVFIVSQIFEKISDFLLTDQICLEYCELKNIFEIFNSLMAIQEDVAKASTSLNSTNSLLASLDEILIHHINSSVIDHKFFSSGMLSIRSPMLANFVLDPMVSGMSGVALLENGANEFGDLLSYTTKYLHPNQSAEDLLEEKNLVVASFIPQILIESWNKPTIILTIFFNDILFQSSNTDKYFSSGGNIISLNIINSDSNFSAPIPLFFRSNISTSSYDKYESMDKCGYWNFTSTNGWSSTGCLFNELSMNFSNSIVLCECFHLTHFANMINSIEYDSTNEKILNLITLVGCSLSLLGIIGIFLTALSFRSWRSKSSSKFLLQLSATIALQMILWVFINSDEDVLAKIAGNIYGCIALGALMHYSVLVMFFWMLIVAYLQFIRYVIVFNQLATANFLVKSSIFGWCMPMLPVFLVIAIEPKSYIPSSTAKLCYPSGYGLLFGVLLPIALIVIANIFVFISVTVSLIKGSSKSAACKISHDKNEAIWSQLRLSVFLFFVLGMAWIFGFLSMNGSIIFSYLFCINATIQGFVLFLYFVVLDPVARNLWKNSFLRMCLRKRN